MKFVGNKDERFGFYLNFIFTNIREYKEIDLELIYVI